MNSCPIIVRQHVTFDVANADITERQIACRVCMMIGVCGQLSWFDGDEGMPHVTQKTRFGHSWSLGNGFVLDKVGEQTYRLNHAEAKIAGLREFLEWVFQSEMR